MVVVPLVSAGQSFAASSFSPFTGGPEVGSSRVARPRLMPAGRFEGRAVPAVDIDCPSLSLRAFETQKAKSLAFAGLWPDISHPFIGSSMPIWPSTFMVVQVPAGTAFQELP